ncbi:MAG: hypothetical protein VKI93_05770 [Synechococcus sp.]|nr:hypothetical protein [Synechococcus sp.]
MKNLLKSFIAIATLLVTVPATAADSELLNGVKRNPEEARRMCDSFRDLNRQGRSAYDRSTTTEVARSRQLSRSDAEVLITYVVGMHCADVR